MGREPSVPIRLVVVATVGCAPMSGGEEGGTGPAPDPRIELGEIDARGGFTPYDDGTEEPIIMGLQGGFHIFVDARLLDDPGADEYAIALALSYDNGSPLTEIEHLRAPELTDDEGNPTFPEMIIFIDDPVAAAGRDVVLRADVDAENAAVDGAMARLLLLAAAED